MLARAALVPHIHHHANTGAGLCMLARLLMLEHLLMLARLSTALCACVRACSRVRAFVCGWPLMLFTLSLASTSARFSISAFTVSSWPKCEAMYSGV
jgi:hypothetical protein